MLSVNKIFIKQHISYTLLLELQWPKSRTRNKAKVYINCHFLLWKYVFNLLFNYFNKNEEVTEMFSAFHFPATFTQTLLFSYKTQQKIISQLLKYNFHIMKQTSTKYYDKYRSSELPMKDSHQTVSYWATLSSSLLL